MTNEKATGKTDEEINYKIFDLDYFDIPYSEMENDGGIIICLDPKKRLGEKTYSVLRTHSNKEAVPDALGLFWDLIHAKKFAARLSERQSTVIPESLNDCRLTEDEIQEFIDASDFPSTPQTTLIGIRIGAEKAAEKQLEKFALFLGKAGKGLPNPEYFEMPSSGEFQNLNLRDFKLLKIGITGGRKDMHEKASAALAAKEEQHRKEMIDFMNHFLERPDILIDAVQNEYTDHSAESLLHDFDLSKQNKNREGEK